MPHLIGEYEDRLLFPVLYNCRDVSNPIFNKAVKGLWPRRQSSSRRRGLMRTNMHGRNQMTVQGRSLCFGKVIFLHYTETLSGITIKSLKKKAHKHQQKVLPVTGKTEHDALPWGWSLTDKTSSEGQNDDGKTKLVSDLIFWQKNIHLGTYLEDFLARWNEAGIFRIGRSSTLG